MYVYIHTYIYMNLERKTQQYSKIYDKHIKIVLLLKTDNFTSTGELNWDEILKIHENWGGKDYNVISLFISISLTISLTLWHRVDVLSAVVFL